MQFSWKFHVYLQSAVIVQNNTWWKMNVFMLVLGIQRQNEIIDMRCSISHAFPVSRILKLSKIQAAWCRPNFHTLSKCSFSSQARPSLFQVCRSVSQVTIDSSYSTLAVNLVDDSGFTYQASFQQCTTGLLSQLHLFRHGKQH